MTMLLSPAEIAGLSLKNRVVMSPMCMYEVHKEDGLPTAFHRVHYGSRAIAGVGLIIQEATAVEADGRLTNRDLGIWTDEQANALSQMVDDLHYLGTQVGVQLGHGGRKAHDAIDPIAPSAIGYGADFREPREMTLEDIERVKKAFVDAAKRADKAGYDMIELHGAHGYLINQFLEAQSNQRSDNYGGSLENRFRFLKEVVEEIKKVFLNQSGCVCLCQLMMKLVYKTLSKITNKLVNG